MIKDNPVIQKGIRRLRNMGLKVVFEEVVEDRHAVMAIDIDSILRYIKRVVMREVRFPNMYVSIDYTNKMIEIHLWKGETPEIVRDLKSRESLISEYEAIKDGGKR